MEISTSTINNTIAPTVDNSGTKHSHFTLRIIFGIIACLALLGNGLVCITILRERTNLRNSYNLMILALAFVDMFTGIVLIITPAFIIGDENFPVPSGVGGELFCRLVSSHYFVFTFGKISVAIVMFLAIDRWYAIARPLKYQTTFKRRVVIRNLVLIGVLCCVMNSRALIEKRLVIKDRKASCKWISLTRGKLAAQIYVVVHVTVTFFIPLSIAWTAFGHLWLLLKKSAFHARNRARSRPLMRLIRMCAFTALFLGICWMPNQLYFLLSKFDVTQLDTPLHHMTAVLSMFNCCVNPWIYGATNKKYRKEFKRTIFFWQRNQVTQDHTEMTNWQGDGFKREIVQDQQVG